MSSPRRQCAFSPGTDVGSRASVVVCTTCNHRGGAPFPEGCEDMAPASHHKAALAAALRDGRTRPETGGQSRGVARGGLS